MEKAEISRNLRNLPHFVFNPMFLWHYHCFVDFQNILSSVEFKWNIYICVILSDHWTLSAWSFKHKDLSSDHKLLLYNGIRQICVT